MRLILTLATLATATVPAFAQPTPVQTQPSPPLAQPVDAGSDPQRDTFTIGLGAAYNPSYIGSDNYVVTPIGVLRGKVSGFDFSLRGPQLAIDVVRDGGAEGVEFQLGPLVGIRLDRTSRIRDPRVAALGDFDIAVEVGGFAGVSKTGVITSEFDTLSAQVAYVRDVSNVHDSFILTPSIDYGTPLSRQTYVGLSLSASIVGDRFGQTYYGVTPAGSVASGLRPYSAGGGIRDVGVGIVAAQSLSGDIRRGASVFAIANYSQLLGKFKRSPIVTTAGDADQYFIGGGFAYTF